MGSSSARGTRGDRSCSGARRGSRSSRSRGSWPPAVAVGEAGAATARHDVLRFANWPLYIDVDEATKARPTLDQFTDETGITVEYFEEINDNAEYFAKVQGPLSQGQGIDRDIFVFTDNSRFPGCSSSRSGCRSSTRS